MVSRIGFSADLGSIVTSAVLKKDQPDRDDKGIKVIVKQEVTQGKAEFASTKKAIRDLFLYQEKHTLQETRDFVTKISAIEAHQNEYGFTMADDVFERVWEGKEGV